MKVLLTNDDGIDAPGLAAMEAAWQLAMPDLGPPVVAAPNRGYSSCGHIVTFMNPLQVEQNSVNRHKVFGTPADCARLGICEFAPDTEFVLSGINAGANVGTDLWMSGTVAAVREAAWLGVPGIAVSQFFKNERPHNWERAAKMTARVLRELLEQPLDGAFYNVNLPDVDTSVEDIQLVRTFVEPKHLRVSFHKNIAGEYCLNDAYRERPRTKGSDVDVCFGGNISISKSE